MRRLVALLASLVPFALASSARADVTSWLAVGGGYAFERNDVAASTDRAAALTMTVGVGSTPRARFVVGGVFRAVTYFTLGTDLGVAARFASGGFARGDWGLAFDAGVGGRFWGQGDYGRYPLQGVLTFGAPWGVQLAVGADVWNIAGDPPARGAFAVLELDLLRLTLMRQGSTDGIWMNPLPAGGREGR